MTLTKWNPFQDMQALHEDMNRLFSRFDPARFDSMRFDGGEGNEGKLWMLPMDVIETGDELKLKASLPGIDPKEINVQVENNVLTVSAERRLEDKVEDDKYCWIEQQYGSFTRSLTLPQHADTERIEARYYNGVLELRIPKRETAKPRKIELTGVESGRESRMIEAGADSGTGKKEKKS